MLVKQLIRLRTEPERIMKYVVEIQGGRFGGTIVEAGGIEEAAEKARHWLKGLGLGDRASHLGCLIVDEEGGELTIQVELGGPNVPPCWRGRLHVWQSPHAVVGGSPENPGVRTGEGEIHIVTVCGNCGTYRHQVRALRESLGAGEQTAYSEPDLRSNVWVLQRLIEGTP